MKNIQKGFIVPFLLIIIALVLVGGGLYMYEQSNPSAVGSPTTQTTSVTQDSNQSMLQKASVSDREKAYDAIIQSDLQGIRTESSLYYSAAGNNSYTGVCASHTIANYLTAHTVNMGITSVCNSSAKAYAASSPLATDNSKFYCVDSTGFSGKVTTPLGTSTVCPTK